MHLVPGVRVRGDSGLCIGEPLLNHFFKFKTYAGSGAARVTVVVAWTPLARPSLRHECMCCFRPEVRVRNVRHEARR